VPGKEEFAETLRYFGRRLEVLDVDVQLKTRATADDLVDFDHVLLATGVVGRTPAIEGVDHPKVLGYADVLAGRAVPGERVAVIGAGGIGVDVSHWLTHVPETEEQWKARWGVGDPATHRGGLTTPVLPAPARRVTLVQRKETPIGIGLGRTSGWAHRATLKQAQVTQVRGARYVRIDDAGLHLEVAGEPVLVECDHVVLCAGQESVRDLVDPLASHPSVHVVGGADVAAELDAKRAIEQGTRVVAGLR